MNSLGIEQSKKDNLKRIEYLREDIATRREAMEKLKLFAEGLSDKEIKALSLREKIDSHERLLVRDEEMLGFLYNYQKNVIDNAVPNFSIEVFRSDDKIIHIQQACVEASGRWCTYASEESFMNNKKLCPECKRVFIMKQLAK